MKDKEKIGKETQIKECDQLMKFMDCAYDEAISSRYDEIHIKFSEDGPLIKGLRKKTWNVLRPGKFGDLY